MMQVFLDLSETVAVGAAEPHAGQGRREVLGVDDLLIPRKNFLDLRPRLLTRRRKTARRKMLLQEALRRWTLRLQEGAAGARQGVGRVWLTGGIVTH